LSVAGLATAIVELTGSFIGSLVFEGSLDGITWFPIIATKLADGSNSDVAIKPGHYRLNVTGLNVIRCNIILFTSGSVTAKGYSSSLTAPSQIMRQSSSIIEDVLFSDTVNAGASTAMIDMDITNESEAWLLVNTDKQPWSLIASRVDGVATNGTLYPIRMSYGIAHATYNNPAASLYLGLRPDSTYGLVSPTSMIEAKQYMLPPRVGSKVGFTNGSLENASVTIRIIRIWR